VPGRTSRTHMGPYDVLTGFMSGCLITRWMDRGVAYAGHVGTVESDMAVNQTVRRAFAAAMPPGTTGFNPLAAWVNDLPALAGRFSPPKVPNVCALVTTQGEFYSVVMFNDGPNEYYCGGAKRVPPLSYDQLRQQMLR